MADTARGQVSMTPIVTNAGYGDSDDVDVIHNEVGGSVGGKLEYVVGTDSGTYRWYYDAETDVTTNSNLISGNFSDAAVAIVVGDLVKYLSITNTGKDSAGDTTEAEVHLTLDGTAPKASVKSFMVGQNESCVIKPGGDLTVGNLHAATSTDASVICKVVAMLKDV